MRQILRQFADLAQRFVLCRTNDRGQQPVFDRHRDAEIDIRVLDDRVALERGVHARHLDRGLNRPFQDKIVYCDFGGVSVFACGF